MAENWSLLWTGRDTLYPVIVMEDFQDAERYAASLNEAVRKTSEQVHPGNPERAQDFFQEHQIKVKLIPAVKASESIPSFSELQHLRRAAQ